MQFDAKVKTYGEQTEQEQVQGIEKKRLRWGVW